MADIQRKAVRAAFGEALVELGEQIPNFVVLDADISSSLNTYHFAKKFPERHINFGVAEQNMMIGAAGLSTTGLIPLACTYATFASMRACEQIRSFICYANLNVKITVSHGGIEVGWDGPTHQATEDIAMTRAMPNMTVVVPADSTATKALIRQVILYNGPVYFRMGRNPVPVIYENTQPFEIGKAIWLSEGEDLTLVATGVMVSTGLEVVEGLAKQGIRAGLLDMHTIKPVDRQALVSAAEKTSLIVTLEDHNIIGGLGSAVAEALSEAFPRRILRIGVPDQFSESGDPTLLFRKFGMDADSIVRRIVATFSEKNKSLVR
jgi:transketolase